jgi:hypothetical protein
MFAAASQSRRLVRLSPGAISAPKNHGFVNRRDSSGRSCGENRVPTTGKVLALSTAHDTGGPDGIKAIVDRDLVS